MNICERALKWIYEELKLFKSYNIIKDIDGQYFYVLGILDSYYAVNIISSNNYNKLTKNLKYEYDYHRDRIGGL